jgi:hypothetical protein
LRIVFLLYLDESGNEDNPDDRHFVIAGAALHERQPHWLTQRIDAIQQRHFPDIEPVQFHAAKIRANKGFWRSLDESLRVQLLPEIADAISQCPPQHLHLFGAVVEKTKDVYGEEAVRVAVEVILKRFDTFLIRQHKSGQTERGLLVFAEGRFDRRVKILVSDFRALGTKYGAIRNLADNPFFASMKESRVLQAADYIAHALFLFYERRDNSLIKPILNRFARETGGRLLGISHHHPRDKRSCDCPACMSYEHPGELSPWL